MKKFIFITTILCAFVLTGCAILGIPSQEERQLLEGTFAEARAGFTTTLTENVTNRFAIPQPPEGIFSLVHFQSDVGPLAAYISSDPGDGQRHPLIIWVSGGWSNAISDLPWIYPEWDNDQTASAFREAGILMMYPSFRGANGNPGYHETLYGEIDDIVAAFNFAASLPYVDPNRIYLGGHSTGATRVLLAAAYTDVFRAAFAFGPVDEIGEHNRAQFTFDIRDGAERMMRSPIHWLDDIATPTFIIEGRAGNAESLQNIQNATDNENVFVYIIESGDHFDVLAPLTRLAAQRILADTGTNPNISFTQQEMQTAMNMPPVSPMPIMLPHHNEEIGASFLLPFIWEGIHNEPLSFTYMPTHFDNNFWEASYMFVDTYHLEVPFYSVDELAYWLGLDEDHEGYIAIIDGQEVPIWADSAVFESGTYIYFVAAFQMDTQLTVFEFYTPIQFTQEASQLFEKMIYSVRFE